MREDVYETITNKVMDLLNQGIIPWRRPWINGGAVNWKTQKPYRGINVFLLDPGEYATYKQIAEAGGRVKKGQKGHFIVFWTWLEKKSDDEEEKTKRIPFLRHYIVFEINKQCEGLTFIDHQRTLLVSHL